MFHPSKACQLGFCQQPKQLCSTGRKNTTFLLYPASPNFPDCCAQHNELIQTLSMIKYYTIFGAAPNYRDETQAKGLIHNHKLKLQQWHSSDFFTEVWAKCFNEQDENGHSRFDPVHFQIIQYESYFLQTSSLKFVNMVFLLSAVKPHTTYINIFSLIFTTFTSFAFPLQPAKWRATSLQYIKHYEYLLRNWDLTGFCCFNIYISISLDQKITKSAKQTNCRSQINTILSITYGKVKSYNVIGK